MPLKPFTYPLPETRFLHAGRRVYKLKIRYGNFLSMDDLDNNGSTIKELEEAIRVIIGNLGNLHPFATQHLTIFPYLSKWERVSKLRFKHGDTFLAPYPYVCTMYVELNSFQQSVFVGKEADVDACNISEDTHLKYKDPAALQKDYGHKTLREPLEYSIKQSIETTKKEDKIQLLEQISLIRNEGKVESKGRSFLELLKSTFFPPRQRFFDGNM